MGSRPGSANSSEGWSEIQDSVKWDDFVSQNGGSIFHRWAWRELLQKGGSRPLYLAYLAAEGSILAVCPFFYRSGTRLRYLESLPDSYTAGPLISTEAKNQTRILEELRKAVKFSFLNRVVAMRIRTHRQQVIEPMMALGYDCEVTHGLFVVDLKERSPDHIWNDCFRKHDRQAVKHYEKMGFEFRFAAEDRDYKEYTNLPKGTTIFARPYATPDDRASFLAGMRTALGHSLQVAVAASDDETMAGASVLTEPENSMVHLAIVRYLRENNIHSPITYIQWHVINWAAERGFRYVNLGTYSIQKSSMPGHPFFRLRERFGAQVAPICQFTIPISNISYSVAKGISKVIS